MNGSDPPDTGSTAGADATEAPAAAPERPGLACVCPRCGTSIPLAEAPAGGLVECPSCGAQFFAASGNEEEEEARERERAAEVERRDRETEFDENRIKQFETLRRSLVRTRTYFILGAAGCAAVAAQLLYYAWPYWGAFRAARAAGRHIPPVELAWPLGLVAAAVAACFGCVAFLKRVRAMTRELAVPMQTDPLTPPDFSTLSDGSQRQEWRKLEEMHAGGGGEVGSRE